MPKQQVQELALLDFTKEEFQQLSDSKSVQLLKTATEIQKGKTAHATLGLICGTICYLTSVAACIFLALHGYLKLAGLVLGTPVLTVIKRMLDNRV